MKTSERIALLYTASLAGAAGLAYYRGRRGTELMVSTLYYGLTLGTVVNVGAWLLIEEGEEAAFTNPIFATHNRRSDLGKASKKAVKLLERVNPELYDDFKENGVKVGAIPANPSMVN